jgi:hypothetical protein
MTIPQSLCTHTSQQREFYTLLDQKSKENWTVFLLGSRYFRLAAAPTCNDRCQVGVRLKPQNRRNTVLRIFILANLCSLWYIRSSFGKLAIVSDSVQINEDGMLDKEG